MEIKAIYAFISTNSCLNMISSLLSLTRSQFKLSPSNERTGNFRRCRSYRVGSLVILLLKFVIAKISSFIMLRVSIPSYAL